MFQAPTTDSPERATAAPAPPHREAGRELHPLHSRSTGEVRPLSNAAASLTPTAIIRRRVAGLQHSIGNQAVLRALGNADRTSLAGSAPSFNSVIRRKCSCGGEGPECDSCKQKREDNVVQRKAADGVNPVGVPSLVHRVLGSVGQPLHTATRAMFEPRFGRSFASVRIHTGAEAAQSARDINAQAYAAGNSIVFGDGAYSPHSVAGQHLLAHELAHVAQQGGGPASAGSLQVGGVHDPAEADADRTADAVMNGAHARPGPAAPALRRTVVVSPAAASSEIATHFGVLCPGKFSAAGPNITGTCDSSTSASCDCLCDVVNDASRTYTLNVAAAAAGTAMATLFDGTTVSVPTTSVFPATAIAPNPTINMPSTSSNVEFGEFNATGGPIWAPLWRVLEHELCSHARLSEGSGGTRGNRKQHDVTIDTENLIAAEHGEPLRGHFADPRQGESFLNPAGDRSKVVFFQVNGEHFEAP